MNENEFIFKIREAYLKAREPIISSGKIKRGTSHTVSSITEDLFAGYIESKIHKNLEIWIDPQIIIQDIKNKSGKRPLLIRPDVCVFNPERDSIEMIFDIKMDLGYKRNEFIQQVEKRVSQLNKILKHKGKCSLKENSEFVFSSNLKWNYIVISKGNISDAQYSKVMSFFKNSKKAKLFTLVVGKHLNEYEDAYLPKINKEDFDRLNNDLKSLSAASN